MKRILILVFNSRNSGIRIYLEAMYFMDLASPVAFFNIEQSFVIVRIFCVFANYSLLGGKLNELLHVQLLDDIELEISAAFLLKAQKSMFALKNHCM